MIHRHFRTRAEIERQMLAARQLRSDMLADATRTVAAFAGTAIRRILLRIADHAPRQFPIATDRAPGVDGPRS